MVQLYLSGDIVVTVRDQVRLRNVAILLDETEHHVQPSGEATTPPVLEELSGLSDAALVSRTVHELASPLTVVGGFAETLLRHHSEMTPSQRERYLSAITRHTERLSRIVSDLGHLQRARSGRVEVSPHPTSMTDAIRDALQIASSAAGFDPSEDVNSIMAQLDMTIEMDEDIIADVDETHLVRMMVNLVENSMKYGEGPRRITVTASRSQVVVSVADHGDGIPRHLHTSIFEPYERGDKQRLAGVPGSGLGLAIVDELSRLNGGGIRLVDTTRGACFEITLPAATVQSAAGNPTRS